MRATSLLSLFSAAAGNAEKPNVLFVVIDDLGFNDMGWSQRMHGFEPTVQTPTLDGLARDGVILDNYYVDTVCSPTRATFMTGRYPIHNTVDDFIHPETPGGLPLNETTIADLMGRAGYATHAVGKWHLGYYKWEYTPTFRGFDSFFGYYEGAEDYFTHERSGSYDLHREEGRRCGANCSVTPDLRGQYSTNIFTAEAVSLIMAHAQAAARVPWFIYLAYQSVHTPLQAPAAYYDRYNATPGFAGWAKGQQTIAAMLACVDDGVANISAALGAAGEAGDTLWVVSADNGGTGSSSNYPLRGGKHSIWEGGVRGAAFVHGWGLAQVRGTVSRELAHGADWLPTLVASVAGGSTAGTLPLDGVDQWAALSTGSATRRDEVVYGHEKGAGNCGVRRGRWKLLRAGGDTPNGWDAAGYGLNGTAARAHGAACNATHGVCCPSHDLAPHTENSTEAACCALCEVTAGCAGFTWRTDNLRCFLKQALADCKPGACVSAAAQGPAPAPAPPGPAPAPPSPAAASLYDLAADPQERTDVAAANPAVVQQLLGRLAEVDAGAVPGPQGEQDPSCPGRTAASDPVVGSVWMPWC